MLTVPEQLMHATVRIECELADGSASTGTGFFFKFLEDGKNHVPVLVTNKHVIKSARRGAFHLTKRAADGSPMVGSHVRWELDNFEAGWVGHPDDAVDLAVFPCASLIKQAAEKSITFFYVSLDPALVPSREAIESLVGFDDILMVGYPNGIWDSANNLPILRAGKTATHPKYDYEGNPQFLIDCACFPGSSGSPVFIYNRGGWSDRSGNIMVGQERVLFLGVLFAGPQHVAVGQIDIVEVPELARVARAISGIPSNLGFVIKSAKLMDFEKVLRERISAA